MSNCIDILSLLNEWDFPFSFKKIIWIDATPTFLHHLCEIKLKIKIMFPYLVQKTFRLTNEWKLLHQLKFLLLKFLK
jgi:hypothetical protein